MPYVYVMFSRTNTNIGRMIRRITGVDYNHVSISKDADLSLCYSFARRNKYDALAGGFVVEHASRLCEKGDVPIRVCQVYLNEEQAQRMEHILQACQSRPDEMIYNTYGAIFSVLGIHLALPDSFTCVEFVGACLGLRTISIADLMRRLHRCTVYEGSYLKWSAGVHREDEAYFMPLRPAQVVSNDLQHFGELTTRLLYKIGL